MKRSKRIKILYGLGFSSMGIKDALFQLFLFFYFSQILGLSGTYTGLATIIALFFDAITDPWVGTSSDRWRSKNMEEDILLCMQLPFLLGFHFSYFLHPSRIRRIWAFFMAVLFSTLVRVALTFFSSLECR